MNLKSILKMKLFAVSLLFSAPDETDLIHKSKSALSYNAYIYSGFTRDGSKISNNLTSLQLFSTYRKFSSDNISYNLAPGLGIGIYSNEINYVNLNLGLGVTKFFLQESKGPTITFTIGNRTFLMDDFNTSSIFINFSPGYMVQLKDEFYLNTGLSIESYSDFIGRYKRKFEDISMSYVFGITQYF